MFCRTCNTRAVSFGKQWQTTECDTAYKTIVSRPMVCVVASSNGLCGGIVQRWVCLHRPIVSVVASWRKSYWFSIFITGFIISITWFSISITKLLKNKCTLSKLPLHSQIDVGLKKKNEWQLICTTTTFSLRQTTAALYKYTQAGPLKTRPWQGFETTTPEMKLKPPRGSSRWFLDAPSYFTLRQKSFILWTFGLGDRWSI